MAIYLGSTEITPAILSGVDKIYLGSKLVWSAGLPVGTVYNFEYTGSVQSVELPKGKYKLQCWGAQGGTSAYSSYGAGSKGGYSEGVITLTKTTTLYIFVGGKGSSGSSASLTNGGWNGGGASVGYSTYNSGDTKGTTYPACGGGATDISTVTSSMSYSRGRTNRSAASLLARCIVAGGGAGGSYRITSVTTTTTSESLHSSVSAYSTPYSFGSDGKAYMWFYFANSSDLGGKTIKITFDGGDSSYWNNPALYKTNSSTTSDRTYISAITINSWKAMPSSVGTGIQIALTMNGTAGESTAGIRPTACNVYVQETTSSTSESKGYSNQAQQGGGTSGRGQYPGTQSSAGTGGGFGYGANQESTNYRYCAGAGGGGWYGGGTGQSDSSTSYVNYTGGGSGFVNTSANASYRPSGYTGLQIDSGTTTAGNTSHPSTSGGTETGHSGNGYARITVIE